MKKQILLETQDIFLNTLSNFQTSNSFEFQMTNVQESRILCFQDLIDLLHTSDELRKALDSCQAEKDINIFPQEFTKSLAES